MLQLLIITLLVILLGFLIKHYYYVHKISLALAWVDGPKPLPLLGNALDLKNTVHLLVAVEEYMKKYNGVVKISIGSQPQQIFMSDVEMLKVFMLSMKCIDKSVEYDYTHHWLNFGLLTSGGNKWQQRRKLITPTFHFQILEQFVEIFNASSDVLVKELKQELGKDSFDVYSYISLFTLDVICESAMGIQVNAQINKDSEYVHCVKEMGDIILRRYLSPIKQIHFFYRFTLDSFKEKRAVRILHDFTTKVIRNRREQLKNVNDEIAEGNDFGIKKRSPFLDTLIKGTINGKPLSDTDVREEVDTFMFEGHDTTSSALSFALYALSTHPHIQEKVYEEIQSILGNDKDKCLTYDDLQNMKYLEMVIKETMRLYTTVPFIGRELTEDMEYNGKKLPKGLNITFFLFGTHRNPEIYPDPHKFDPERFTVENQAKRHPFAFIPFSAGPRNCIGQKFAMLELKCAIAKILRHYALEPVADYKPILVNEVTLKSVNGIQVKIIARRSK